MSIPGTDALSAEPKTAYVAKSTTPGERCSNCSRFESPNECNGPKMIQLSKQPRSPEGNVIVAAAGHCKFWDAKKV